jgi:dsDNA-specific endonuclease/ATPase MutS2
MDQKTLATLEFQKILERLSGYTGFNASADKARRLQPTADIDEAHRRQEETAEALQLLATNHDLTIGERAMREQVELAAAAHYRHRAAGRQVHAGRGPHPGA